MTRLIAGILFVGLMLSGTAYGMPKGIGLGLIVGEPTGIVAKKWLSETAAVDGAVAWSFGGDDSLHLHGDYLLHNGTLIQVPEVKGDLPVYYGVGARIKFKDNNNGDSDVLVGIRVPFGISYLPDSTPLDFFVEVAPIMDFVPDTELDLNAAIGVRYYFQ